MHDLKDFATFYINSTVNFKYLLNSENEYSTPHHHLDQTLPSYQKYGSGQHCLILLIVDHD